MHRRFCEVCRFHSVGICHLATSQVSAIPVRVAAASTANPHDEVSSQVSGAIPEGVAILVLARGQWGAL